MKEKVKKGISKGTSLGLGVLCDLALIYNFIHRDVPTGWNLYCQRYITLYTIYSWFVLVCMVIAIASLEIAFHREEYRKKNIESLTKSIEGLRPKLWRTLWRWLDTIPMLVFVGVFVGNYWLFTVWGLLTLFGFACEQSAMKLEAKIKAPPQTFGDIMEELNKKSSLN
jgi:hypothetical protein